MLNAAFHIYNYEKYSQLKYIYTFKNHMNTIKCCKLCYKLQKGKVVY